ncbi:MAG: hypothetical protein ISR98_00660 [Parcubacteria group bacterium]|nr:hypothetical protein [Parcubacteria group bacterium]
MLDELNEEELQLMVKYGIRKFTEEVYDKIGVDSFASEMSKMANQTGLDEVREKRYGGICPSGIGLHGGIAEHVMYNLLYNFDPKLQNVIRTYKRSLPNNTSIIILARAMKESSDLNLYVKSAFSGTHIYNNTEPCEIEREIMMLIN